MGCEYEYLMPDYYPEFGCKMGKCRTSCCEGWPVSVTEEDYFRLLGLDCSAEIRHKLDCSLHIKRGATVDSFAELSHDYQGNCQLRMPDGRCMIQATLGEETLPLICKLYPRAYRNEGDRECSCSNSCERTVELLLHHREPLKFISRKPEFTVPDVQTPSQYAETFPENQKLRLLLISLLQDRRFTLPARLSRFGYALEVLDGIMKNQERIDFEKILGAFGSADDISEKVCEADLFEGLSVVEKMMEAMDRYGATLNRYGEEILKFFGNGRDTYAKYEKAVADFANLFPDWEIGFENLLVNHLFFSRYPFADGKMTLRDEYSALAMVYTSMRFLAVGWTVNHPTEEDLVDILSAAFRLIEHSPFHPYAAAVLHREHFDSSGQLDILLRL